MTEGVALNIAGVFKRLHTQSALALRGIKTRFYSNDYLNNKFLNFRKTKCCHRKLQDGAGVGVEERRLTWRPSTGAAPRGRAWLMCE